MPNIDMSRPHDTPATAEHHHKPSLWQRLGRAETYLDNLALILIAVLGIVVAVGMFLAPNAPW